MLAFFGILSGLIPLLGVFPYLRDTLETKTKPHRASYLIWTLLGAIAFFSQLASGARWSLIVPAEDTLGTLGIFILALRSGEGGFNRRDKAAIGLAVVGLVVWYFTKQPITALVITTIVDAIGMALTVHKTYLDPTSETFSTWLFASIGGVFAALAVGKISFALLLFPIYLILGNGAVAAVILRHRRATARST